MNSTFLNEKKYKIIWIGDSGVGKTCLLIKAQKHLFEHENKSTLGFEYYNITINLKNNKKILLQTWDTCGQESYKSIANIFYKRVKLAILVYSIDSRQSFDGLNYWLNEIRTKSQEDVKLILVGNKSDLNETREVSYEEGNSFSQSQKFDYFLETSAKEGDTPYSILRKAAEILYKDSKEKEKIKSDKNDNYDSESFSLDEHKEIKQNNFDSCDNCI